MIGSQHPFYDYSKLIASAKDESQYESFSTFIDEKIHEFREEHFAGEVRCFNRSVLAEMIGVESSTLTKIINGSQATRKRDIIIAICFALQMRKSEADLALNLYPMAPLNPQNLRDLVIIQALHDRVSVKQLDDILKSHGMPQLNILRGKKKREERAFYIPLESTSYEELSVEILPYCVGKEDSELSLNMRYRPDQFLYQGEMIIQRKGKHGPKYRISIESDACYNIEILEGHGWKLLYSDDQLQQEYEEVDICEEHDLLNEIAKLNEYTERKARYVYHMCNDTRNYGTRFNAVNDDGKLVIYGEGFNFEAPELSEYYQLEVTNDGCQFSVSNKSRFLERYLGPEEWRRAYGTVSSSVGQSYKSLDEVQNERQRTQFWKLLQSAYELLDKLKTRKLFIFNARGWFDISALMHYFHVEDAFECYTPDDLACEIIPKKNHIIGADGRPITIDDLYRAAELGIITLEELCAIRTRYGSLEQFLQIDLLAEQKGKNRE